MRDTTEPLCGRIDGARTCADKCWRASVLGHEPCPARRPSRVFAVLAAVVLGVLLVTGCGPVSPYLPGDPGAGPVDPSPTKITDGPTFGPAPCVQTDTIGSSPRPCPSATPSGLGTP